MTPEGRQNRWKSFDLEELLRLEYALRLLRDTRGIDHEMYSEVITALSLRANNGGV